MNPLKFVLLALALGACAAGTDQATEKASPKSSASAPTVATVGLPAPGFTLTDQNGKAHDLSDFLGKPVVLEWFNHGCPFVKKYYSQGDMPQLQERYQEKGVVWLSICSSAEGKQGYFDADQAASVIAEHGMQPTAVMRDTDGTVGRLYAAKTTPHMFVIDADGVLVYDGAIDSERSADQADIAGATNYVAKTLDALLAGESVEPQKNQPYGCGVKY